MKRKFYNELWNIRFRKMLGLEKRSIVTYQGLLGECKKAQKFSSIATHLERLIKDEKKHVELVEELIAILRRQPK